MASAGAILVSGATGTNGRDIVRELSRLGNPVRAMARDVEKAAALEGPGVELVAGDFARPETLGAALRGVGAALLLVPVDEKMAEYGLAFVDAAKRAGVGRIVQFSAVGATPNGLSHFTKSHGRIEERVKTSGIAWTILRPNFFMQNLLGSAATIKGQNTYYNIFGDGLFAPVDTRDIAAVAAHALAEDGHEGNTYGITGPAAVTCGEVAAALAKSLGREIKFVNVPRDAYAATLAGTGMPEWLAQAITDLDEVVNNGEAGRVEGTVARVAKRPAITLERFIADHVEAFKG